MRLTLVALLCACVGAAAQNTGKPWAPGSYPNPTAQPERCNRRPGLVSYVCDADSLMTQPELDTIEVGPCGGSGLRAGGLACLG